MSCIVDHSRFSLSENGVIPSVYVSNFGERNGSLRVGPQGAHARVVRSMFE